jgi:L-asparaginase
MVTSLLDPSGSHSTRGCVKRGAGVMGLKNVRHPIQLARESLLRTTAEDGEGGSMHCQLVGSFVEEKGREWGLEFLPDEWLWTRRRWEEHRRGLGLEGGGGAGGKS